MNQIILPPAMETEFFGIGETTSLAGKLWIQTW